MGVCIHRLRVISSFRSRPETNKAFKLAEEYSKQMETERDKANHEHRNSVAIRDAGSP